MLTVSVAITPVSRVVFPSGGLGPGNDAQIEKCNTERDLVGDWRSCRSRNKAWKQTKTKTTSRYFWGVRDERNTGARGRSCALHADAAHTHKSRRVAGEHDTDFDVLCPAIVLQTQTQDAEDRAMSAVAVTNGTRRTARRRV